jgi:hypothetical protein
MLKRQKKQRRFPVSDFDVTPPDLDGVDERKHLLDATRRRQLILRADVPAGKL